MRAMRSFWRGERSLPVAFWGFYVGGWIASTVVGLTISLILLRWPHTGPLRFLVGALFVSGYPVFAAVGVWRSARPSSFTGVAARVWVSIWPAGLLFAAVNGGARMWLATLTSE
jgi:hypothetical protein